MNNVLYRYEAFCSSDGWCELNLTRYRIIKTTPCGVRIELPYGYPPKNKFVNLNAGKQWANRTPEEAFTAFQARKRRHIAILEAQLEAAKRAITLTPEKPYLRATLSLS